MFCLVCILFLSFLTSHFEPDLICFLLALQVFSFPGDLQLRMASMTPEDYTQFNTTPG